MATDPSRGSVSGRTSESASRRTSESWLKVGGEEADLSGHAVFHEAKEPEVCTGAGDEATPHLGRERQREEAADADPNLTTTYVDLASQTDVWPEATILGGIGGRSPAQVRAAKMETEWLNRIPSLIMQSRAMRLVVPQNTLTGLWTPFLAQDVGGPFVLAD